jgi:ribosomal protein S28E/S33
MIPQRKGKIMMMEDGIREQQWANGNILGEVEKGKILMMDDGIREQQWANGNILGEVEHIIHKLCNTHGDQ